jgi:hypothetical protein
MVLSEFEKFRVEKVANNFCLSMNQHLPPDQAYIDYRFNNYDNEQSLYLLDAHIEGKWGDPVYIHHRTETAMFSYVESKKLWQLFWKRKDLQWYPYNYLPSSTRIDDLFEEVMADRFGCFWG